MPNISGYIMLMQSGLEPAIGIQQLYNDPKKDQNCQDDRKPCTTAGCTASLGGAGKMALLRNFWSMRLLCHFDRQVSES